MSTTQLLHTALKDPPNLVMRKLPLYLISPTDLVDRVIFKSRADPVAEVFNFFGEA